MRQKSQSAPPARNLDKPSANPPIKQEVTSQKPSTNQTKDRRAMTSRVRSFNQKETFGKRRSASEMKQAIGLR